jgi:hypothetical protein
LALVSILFYISFAYDLDRTECIKLITLYTGLFFLCYKLIQLLKHDIKLLTWLAFGFRVVFIFAIPSLSQDFYRFIWDGRMVLEGFNPYLFTPESFINSGEFPISQAQELYNGMGSLSAGHFTNYPPLNQLCFVIAGLFAGKSILGSAVVLRLLIITADFGTLYFGKKLLEKLKLPAHNIFWYLLNPFIIIELTGNLHFEGVMIFFIIWSLYLLHLGKWQWAAVILACSISIKLIPLIFLPLIWKHLQFKKGLLFCVLTVLTTFVLFLPFYSPEFLTNYTETVGLWFQNFEFNASFYYLFREVGYFISGYNHIAIIGKFMAVTVFIVVMVMALFRKNNSIQKLLLSMLLALTFYYFLSTTVHPWYVATLLMLSIFTNYKFPLVWSLMIVFSYLAYANNDNTENLWIVAFEYLVVFTVFLRDLKKAKPIEN